MTEAPQIRFLIWRERSSETNFMRSITFRNTRFSSPRGLREDDPGEHDRATD